MPLEVLLKSAAAIDTLTFDLSEGVFLTADIDDDEQTVCLGNTIAERLKGIGGGNDAILMVSLVVSPEQEHTATSSSAIAA